MAFALLFLVPLLWMVDAVLSDSDPCLNHSILPGERRSPSCPYISDNAAICDETLDERWYRIHSTVGNDITLECPKDLYRCNTVFPMWMNDPIPPVSSGIVDRLVCIKRNSGCCEGNVTIKVKNCHTFRVYKLRKPHGCPQGYCFGNNESMNTTDSESCDNLAKKIHSDDHDPFPAWLIVVIILASLVIIFIPCFIFFKKKTKKHEENKIQDEHFHRIEPRKRRIR